MKPLSVLYFFAVLFGFSFLSCSKWPLKTPVERKDIVLTKAQKEVLESSQVFAIDFFKEMCRYLEKDNLFVSPLSASLALSAVTNGGAGTTREDMKSALGFGNFSMEQMNGFYKTLVPALKKVDNTVDLFVANAVWIEKTFPVKNSFTGSLKDYYDASVKKLDFSDPKAPETINKWCKDNTNGMIKKIIDRIDPQYKLFYTNALYFKGDWEKTFDKKTAGKVRSGMPREVFHKLFLWSRRKRFDTTPMKKQLWPSFHMETKRSAWFWYYPMKGFLQKTWPCP